MNIGSLPDVAVVGISCAVPNNLISTENYADAFNPDDIAKFIKLTGIKQRYIVNPYQTASDLCFKAALSLMEKKGWDKSSIDVLVFVSQTPDFRLPATACVLHKRLGLKQECIAFDVNLGCSGYVYGLQIVGSLMQNGTAKRALLLCGDTISKYLSPNDRSATMLFGDAGSATALEKVPGETINFSMRTKGEGYKSIIIPAGACRRMNGKYERTEIDEGIYRNEYDLAMDGAEVFNFTISEVPKSINEFLQHNDESIDSYDAFVFHQANLFILNHIAKKLKIPQEKMPVSIDRFGNTSVASIPLTITDLYMKRKNSPMRPDGSRDRLLLSGFGVGLSWGVVSFNIDPKACLPLIYTDEVFLDK